DPARKPAFVDKSGFDVGAEHEAPRGVTVLPELQHQPEAGLLHHPVVGEVQFRTHLRDPRPKGDVGLDVSVTVEHGEGIESQRVNFEVAGVEAVAGCGVIDVQFEVPVARHDPPESQAVNEIVLSVPAVIGHEPANLRIHVPMPYFIPRSGQRWSSQQRGADSNSLDHVGTLPPSGGCSAPKSTVSLPCNEKRERAAVRNKRRSEEKVPYVAGEQRERGPFEGPWKRATSAKNGLPRERNGARRRRCEVA